MIKNLTPHTITIVDDEGNALKEYKPEPVPARVKCEVTRTGEFIDGVPITTNRYFDIENLPEFEDGVFYIVSLMLANACPDRHDLLITNEAVRDAEGRIVGCKSLVCN